MCVFFKPFLGFFWAGFSAPPRATPPTSCFPFYHITNYTRWAAAEVWNRPQKGSVGTWKASTCSSGHTRRRGSNCAWRSALTGFEARLAAVTPIDKNCPKVATFNGPIEPGPAPVRPRLFSSFFFWVCKSVQRKGRQSHKPP